MKERLSKVPWLKPRWIEGTLKRVPSLKNVKTCYQQMEKDPRKYPQ